MKIKIDLPEGFLAEEVRGGYTISAEMKKVWAVELDLLTALIRVCEENGLRYFADGGTLLGAVRHGGYIPWDDDIDIAMPRADFDRLCEIAPKVFPEPYFWQTGFTDLYSVCGFARLRNSETTGLMRADFRPHFKFNQGIWIDIFPLDYMPDDLETRTAFLAEVTGLYKEYKEVKLDPDHPDVQCPAYLMYERAMRRYADRPTGTIGFLCFSGKAEQKYVWEAAWFEESVSLPFEWLRLPAPAGMEGVLEKHYGDWRTPRIEPCLHGMPGSVLFDVDRPYTEYLKEGNWEQ